MQQETKIIVSSSRSLSWLSCAGLCLALISSFVIFGVRVDSAQSLGSPVVAQSASTMQADESVLPGKILSVIDPASFMKFASVLDSPVDPPSKPDYTLPAASNGLAPVLLKIPTHQPVVFLTIDDGAHKDVADLEALQSSHSKATLFLADLFIHNDPTFFTRYTKAGYVVEDHTRSHILRPHIAYVTQKDEVCSEADLQQREFGRRPLLFRPPGGFYDVNTQKAATECGMKAVIMWHAKAESGTMMYQDGNTGLHPGDIVLMHFRPEFKQDLAAFVAAEKAAGLHTELLEDWLLTNDASQSVR